MLDRILVPLDGSALTECTLGHAVKLARAFDARVLLFWVTEPEAGADIVRGDAAKAEAQSYLSRMAGLFEEFGIPVDTEVLEGHPAERTLDLARSLEADLILLSTHRHTGLTQFPLSGTASKVVAGTTDSVMVVRSEEGPTNTLDAPYRTILAALDLTEHSIRSARVAATIARSEGAELVMVTVLPRPEVLGEDRGGERARIARRLVTLNRESAERRLRSLAAELSGTGVRVRWRAVEESDVVQALERLAEAEDASLLVLGARGRSDDAERHHGAVAARLLEHVDRPVLVFQNGAGPGGFGSAARPGEAHEIPMSVVGPAPEA